MTFFITIIQKLFQSVEFFRSGFGKWFTFLFNNMIVYQFFLLPALIVGFIRFYIGLFGSLCTTVKAYFQSINFSGVQVGGVDVFAFANSVLPLDELIGLIVVWFSVVSIVASIRFVRAAWAAIPFKAT